MSWLSKVRAQPKEKKIRLLWIILAVCGVVLFGCWIAIGNYNPRVQKDTSLFKTIGQGIKNFSSQDYKKQGEADAKRAEQLNQLKQQQ